MDHISLRQKKFGAERAQQRTLLDDRSQRWSRLLDSPYDARGSFNGKFRDQRLSSRAEAKVIIEARRRHHNDVRPHSSRALREQQLAARAA